MVTTVLVGVLHVHMHVLSSYVFAPFAQEGIAHH